MKKILGILFQMVIDIIVGMAIYFALTTFAPSFGVGIILVLTLGITALFAEVWEVRKK